MDRVKASYVNERETVMPERISKSKMSLWKPLEYRFEVSGFDVARYAKAYPMISDDFIQLLNMDKKLVMKEDKISGSFDYLEVFQGLRRVTQTKCVLEYNTKESESKKAYFSKIAEVVVGVSMDMQKPNQLEVLFFDNSTDYRAIYFNDN